MLAGRWVLCARGASKTMVGHTWPLFLYLQAYDPNHDLISVLFQWISVQA